MRLGRWGEEEGQAQAGPRKPGPRSEWAWWAASGANHTYSVHPAQGLTLHLSSCDNITGRNAGHVDQVDRTVSLNVETWWKGSINHTNLTSTNITPDITPAKPNPGPSPSPCIAQPHPWVLV